MSEVTNEYATALADLAAVSPGAPAHREFLDALIEPARLIRCFWATFRNVLGFFGTRDGSLFSADAAARRAELERIVGEEIGNTRETIEILERGCRHIVIARRGEWGQCFGPNVVEVFERKLELMKRGGGNA